MATRREAGLALGIVLAAIAILATIGAGIAMAAQLGAAEATGGNGSAGEVQRPAECREEAEAQAEAEAQPEAEAAEGRARECLALEEAEAAREAEAAKEARIEEAQAVVVEEKSAPGVQAGTTIRAGEAVDHRHPTHTDKADGAVSAPTVTSRHKHGGGKGETTSEEATSEAASPSSLSLGGGASTLGSLDIPVALLPVYQACGSQYGISWEVLAAINKIETDFGSNQGPSSAGAEGWMQFLPSTWKTWGVDANGDGSAESSNPVDAICAAARYLKAAGGESDIYAAVLAYNHADWYAREVLADARQYESVPANLVNSLTALAEGSTVPVTGRVSYWNEGKVDEALEPRWSGAGASAGDEGGEAKSVARIGGEAGEKALAVVEGTVAKVGRSAALGRYVVLHDAYGDRFVYSGLGKVTVRSGDRVAAGDELARVGTSGIGFSIQPDGASKLDPTELLELWKEGGAGGRYNVDEAGSGTGASAAMRALLQSSDSLRHQVLGDPNLQLPQCVRAAVRSGELQRQTLASLEYLTSEGFEIGVATSTCKQRSGFAVEIESVDGTAVGGGQGEGTAAYSMVRKALALDGSLAPQRVVSATGLGGSASAGEADAKTVAIDYRPPQKARLVGGEAIAPTDAPAAVQAMIAAANQIDEQPYVWGGGHGAWVSEGYDCSGAVSYVLHAAKMLSSPQTSGALEQWGESGSGRWVTVYANAEHTYAVIAGLRWDTVGDASGTGPRWHTGAAYPSGFTVRHPSGY